jgi:uncharacterized protein YcfJ
VHFYRRFTAGLQSFTVRPLDFTLQCLEFDIGYKAKESSMKQAVLFSAIGVLAASGTMAAAEEIGRVLSSTPVIQQVQVPRQVCGNQTVGGGPTTGGGAVVGGVTGGLLGNAISTGSGGGHAAATALGVLGGALLGNSIEAANNQPRNVQHCTTQIFLENRTVAYNVRYEYAGREYDVQMPYDPGPSIRLQVTPVAGTANYPTNSAPAQQGGVITAPPVQSNGNGNTPMPPVYPPSNQMQQAHPADAPTQIIETPSYMQSPDGYPPPQGGVSSSTYYTYPYYGAYPYYYGYPYYSYYPYYYGYPYYGYYPWFPFSVSLGFGYWGWSGGHGGHGGNWNGNGHHWNGGTWGGGHWNGGGGFAGAHHGFGGGGRR